MADKIVTELDLALNVSKQQRDLAQMAGDFKAMAEASEAVKNNAAGLATPLHTLADGTKEAAQALKSLLQQFQVAAKGNVEALAVTSALKAQKENLKGNESVATSDLLKTQITLQERFITLGKAATVEYQIQLKIQQGIVDMDTLSFQKKQSLAEVGKLISSQQINQGEALEQVNAQLQQEYANLQRINSQMKQIGDAAELQALKIKEASAAARDTERANSTQNLSRTGASAYEQAEATRKIKQGIVDLDTLAYQRQQAQVEVGKLVQQQAVAEASARAGITGQLEQQYNILRTIDQQEEKIQNGQRFNKALSGNGADLLKVQAQLIVNYSLINGALSLIRFGAETLKELDAAFFQLQAIAAISNTEMAKLKVSLLDVAQSSKFSATEITQAAVTLAQAGFSGSQIKDSIKAITQLATASGSDLNTAVANVTSTLNVFSYQANQAALVSNIMTAALNQSKLTMEQLTLGIQYGANTASEANVTFAEMVATFGVLANAGIRSGSTIGTGFQRLLSDLINPTDKFKTKINELGVSLEQVDVKTQGFSQVLHNLQEAGFTASDALSTLDQRAARALIPLLRDADALAIFEQNLYLSNAAIDGTNTQMQSLTNSLSKLQNAFGVLIFDTFESWVRVMAKMADSTANFINALGPLKPFVEVIGNALALIAVGGIAKQLGGLLINLTGVGALFGTLTTGAIGLGRSLGILFSTIGTAVVSGGVLEGMLTLGAGLFATFTSLLSLPVLAFLGTIGAALYLTFGGSADSVEGLNKKLDETNGKIAELQGETDKYQQRGEQLDKFLQTLTAQYDTLNNNSESLKAKTLEAASAFNTMGGAVIEVGDNIDTLISKIKSLRDTNFVDQIAQADKLASQLQNKQSIINEQIRNQKGTIEGTQANALESNIGFFGQQPSRAGKDIAQAIVDGLKGDITSGGLSELITKANNEQTTARNAGDSRTVSLLDPLIKELEKRQNDLNGILKTENDLRTVGNQKAASVFDSFTSGPITTLLDYITSRRKTADANIANNPNTSSAQASITDLKELADSVKKAISVASVIPGEAGSANVQLLQNELAKINDDLISKQQLVTKEIGAQLDISQKTSKLKIEEYQREIKSADADTAQDLANKAIEEAHNIYADARKKFEAQLNSPDAQKTFPTLSRFAPGTQGLADAKKNLLDSELQEEGARLNATVAGINTQLREKLDKLAPELGKDLISDIQGLRNEIRATTTAYTAQINAIDAVTKRAEAQRALKDNPLNAPFFSDATRKLEDQSILAIKAKAAQDKLNATTLYLSQQQAELANAEKLAGVSYEKAAQARDLAVGAPGTSRGGEAGKDFNQNKSEANQSVQTVLKQGDAVVATKKKLEELNDEFIRNGVIVKQNEPFFDTLSNSWDIFLQESQYGAQKLGQDFSKLFTDMRDGVSTFITDFINGNKSISDSFKDLAGSILKDLESIAIHKFTQSLFDSVLGGSGGSAGGSIFSSLFKAIGFASGGLVSGGQSGRDSVPAMLMPDEFVLKAPAVKAIGLGTLNRLNNGNATVANAGSVAADASGGGGNKMVNVYVVTPDQVPTMGPNDVVATVTDNIARGGSLKTLIKSVVV